MNQPTSDASKLADMLVWIDSSRNNLRKRIAQLESILPTGMSVTVELSPEEQEAMDKLDNLIAELEKRLK